MLGRLSEKLVSSRQTLLLMLGICAVLTIVSVLAIFTHIRRLNTRVLHLTSLQSTKLYAQTLLAVRNEYSSQVLSRVPNEKIQSRRAHESQWHMPVPITFMSRLNENELMKQSKIELAVYSEYPFFGGPEEKRQLDSFQKAALARLRKSPDEAYYEFGIHKGQPALRFAVADRLYPSCVHCHNRHPQSPKRDWKLNEVAGVVEIVQPLGATIAASSDLLTGTQWFLLLLASGLLAMAMFGVFRSRARARGLERAAEALQGSLQFQKKRAEELSLSEVRLKAIQRIAEIGSWEWDIRNDTVRWSDELLQMSGRDLGDPPRGKEGFFCMLPEEEKGRLEQVIENALKFGFPFEIEHAIKRPDGGMRKWFTRAEVIRDRAGNPLRVVGTAQDVTERRQLEERLRSDQESLRVMLSQIPAVLWVVDKSLRMESIGGKGIAHYPTAPDDARGKSLYEIFQTTDPSFRPIQAHLEALEGKSGGYEINWEGTVFEVHVEPFRNASGELCGVIGVGLDITQRKEYEESLKVMGDQLRRSNEDLDKFAFIASHDLKEPLRMVISYLKILKDRYELKLDEDARDYMAFALDGALRMRRLIDSLLEYSRLGRRSGAFEVVDLNTIMKQVSHILKPDIEETGVRIIHGPLPQVVARPTEVLQLFQNLIGNAIKFRKPGVPPVVEVVAERAQRSWRISISDNGIGFDPSYREAIFELFRRAPVAEKISGEGMGLAICKRIIDLHGGEIKADSELGKGTSVTFSLPAAEELKRAV